MHTLLDDLATAAHRAGFGWRAQREAARLRREGGPVRLLLAEALEAARTPAPDPTAAAWHHRIEALRTRLRVDPAVLAFDDYGVPHRLAGNGPARRVERPVAAVCRSSAPAHQGRLLYHLARRLRPLACLELGTCLGISAAYLAAGLAEGGGGRLVTLEGGEALAARARTHLGGLGLAARAEVVTGRFSETLPAVLERLPPLGLAFLDGHHDPEATRAYARQLRPHLAPGAVVVVDDVRWTPGMRRAWNDLAEEAAVSTDLLTVGLAVFGPA